MIYGVVSANGSGGLVGVSDGIVGSDSDFSRSYFVAGNVRITMTTTIKPGSGSHTNWVFYVISPSKTVGIDMDAGIANSAIRIIEK
jgi:hypothetical protein